MKLIFGKPVERQGHKVIVLKDSILFINLWLADCNFYYWLNAQIVSIAVFLFATVTKQNLKRVYIM